MLKFDTLNPLMGYFRPTMWFADNADGGSGGTGATTTTNHNSIDFESMPIPADKYSDNPNVSKYKTIGDLIKGHSEVVKLVGSKGVIVPSENADSKEWDKFYNSLGRPEKPDGYKLSAINNLHPELKITPEVEAGFKNMMHKRGISAKIADGIFQDYFGMISQSLTKRDEASKTAREEAETKLRNEWGNDFDKNIVGVKRLVERFGGKDGLSAFDVDNLGNNPAVLRTLAKIVKSLSEDSFVKGGIDLSIDQNGAIARIKQLEADPALMNERDPRHNAIIEERSRLYAIAYPNDRE